MSFPTTSVLDAFNRSNATPLDGSWTNGFFGDEDCKLVSNAVVPTSGNFSGAYYNGSTPGPDCEAFLTVSTHVGTGEIIVYARAAGALTSSPNGYAFHLFEGIGGANIERIDNGANTALGSAISITLANGDQIGISVIGSTIRAYKNGTDLSGAGRSDATYSAAGRLAMEIFGAGYVVDDFGGGTISSGGTVYSKSNTGTAPATASGADQSVWVEQGAGTAPGAASGAKNFLANKPGTATAPHTASGADQSAWVEQGTGTATVTSSGADNFVTADSGTATVPAVASGADQTVFVEQGTGTATAAGSAADNFLTADGGAGTSTATANGTDQTVWVETGTAASPFSASGASQLLHPGGNVYDKTGTGTLTTTASGDTSIVWAEAGTGAAPGTAGGDLGTHGGMGSWVPFAGLYAGGPDGSVKVTHGEPIGLPTEERWRRERAADREQERVKARLDEENLIEVLMLL